MAESLAALRDRREYVISRLSDGYARDLIDVDELERRERKLLRRAERGALPPASGS